MSETLTEQQKKAAILLTSIDYVSKSDAVIAAELSIDRSTLHRWKQKDDFKAYLRQLHAAELRSHRRDADDALLKKAKLGDVPALRLYYELAGDLDEAVRNTQAIPGIKIIIEKPTLIQNQQNNLKLPEGATYLPPCDERESKGG